MKNKNGKKAPANHVSTVMKNANAEEKGSPVTLNQKHHKKPKKVYE